ncbi:ribosomal protein S12 methylthiotransferase accessory factor [Thiohalospira halophila DSM 15071]|uniref:Ribosomal protein S12 methylthiotransferase accessory factor n=1 Tax=Thiohalospira halophila DSM 15071 TaxID=1123397 RepID=A0A1I1RNY0_9GAMM|nr:YcaO-like family protein [Thiohalospira halophila]SFD36055.1 ribosomal protein S12 methylthiotransferase accessory factor [Thiohalospira halophila DSM 15071]
MHTTRIPGKDAAPEQTVARVGHSLRGLRIGVRTTGWQRPVPGVWSLHLRARDCGRLFSNGKGTGRRACLASALGEFVERLATGYFFTDYYLAPAAGDFLFHPDERSVDPARWREQCLDPELLAWYDPDGELDAAALHERNSDGDRITALPFTRHRDGATRYFPANILASLYASNGMAAGNTPAEARVQALSEVLERAARATLLAEAAPMPPLPEAIVERYPAVTRALAALRQRGFRPRAVDASAGGRFPVAGVVVRHPRDGGVIASFGAHPDFGVALERATTELLQGRGTHLAGFEAPTFDDAELAEPHNLELHFTDGSGRLGWSNLAGEQDPDFTPWASPGDNEAAFQAMCADLERQGLDVWVADYPELGLPVCRLLVPGLSEVYPREDLLFENHNEGRAFRDAIAAGPELSAAEAGALLARLENGGYSELQPVTGFIGIAADKGSGWSGLTLGELKLRLAATAGDLDALEESLEAARETPRDARRDRAYRALADLLEWHRQGASTRLRPALEWAHGGPALTWAEAALAGSPWEMGTLAVDSPDAGDHRAVLEVYRRVQAARRKG